jgi:hypothetical protein
MAPGVLAQGVLAGSRLGELGSQLLGALGLHSLGV